jgi:maleate isomerase
VSFQDIVDDLRAALGTTRTTLRLDTPGAVYPVVAESCAPGVRSIRSETAIDLRAAPTFKFLERELRDLIQDNCADADDAPPPELLALYGVKAQMLAPIVRDGRLAGILSVHEASSVRHWTDAEVALLDDAAARINAEL